MRNRRTRFLIAAAALLGLPATAFAAVPTQGVSVSLPGLRAVSALQICTEASGKLSCKKVATPGIRSGRVSASWNRGLRANVAATPVSPFPRECKGRPGTKIDTSVTRVGTDITLSVQASYAGVSTPRTIVSTSRSVDVDKSAAIWACLL
jgi:hypothetical protein